MVYRLDLDNIFDQLKGKSDYKGTWTIALVLTDIANSLRTIAENSNKMTLPGPR